MRVDTVDTLLVNANVRTLAGSCPWGSAVAICGDRIVDFGGAGHFAGLITALTRVIDLRGLTVVPGFHDSHMHVLPHGVFLGYADLSPGAGIGDPRSLAAALRQWSDEHPSSPWALGGRYDQNGFPGAAHATRHDLDAVLPDEPAFVEHTSGHAAVANTAALKLAGITRDTPDPAGGTIVRDAAGEPTGVLLETAAGLVGQKVPAPSRAELVAAVLRAGRALLAAGVTSASDMSLSWIAGPDAIPAYREAVEQGYCVRTALCPCAADFGAPADVPERAAFEREAGLPADGPLFVGPMKLFADGALTTRTAALREPFVDGAGTGLLMHRPEELTEYIHRSHAQGWQVATHAIGDRAIELVLDAYATVEAGQPAPHRRHRIEHAMLLDEALIGRCVQVGAVPTMQPEFVARLGDAYVLGLGEERAARLNPYRSLHDHGLMVPMGSDCPVVPGRPLDGMRAAVARTTPSGRVLGAEQSLTPWEALVDYTMGSAYAVFREAEVGRVMTGMVADLAFLSADPTTNEGLERAEVVGAMVGGQLVHGADALESQ